MSIRKRLAVLALLGTTMLTPAPAHAMPPVVGFIGGFLSAVAPGLGIVGTGAAFGAGVATAGFFGTTFGNLILSIGFSFLQAALTPQPQSTDPGDRLVNYAKPISYFERAYGRVRNGGVMGCTTFRVDRRHYTTILASHSIKGVVEHYLDDDLVEVDENDEVTTPPIGNLGSIRTYTGQPGQAADPTLVSAIPEWTSAHDFAGFAYAALYARRTSAENFTDAYSKGDIWSYAPLIEGNDQIYDPRTDTYIYTNNAALVIAHEIVHTLGGEVDWASVAIEADISDQLVINGEGGSQKRWTINALFSDDQEWDEIKTVLLTACDGFMFERPDGKVGFYVGRWQEPDVVMRDEDFLSLNVSDGLEIGTHNQFVAQYVEPANAYRRTPTGAYVADASTKRATREVPLIAVDNYDQAVRVMARTAAVERSQQQFSGVLKLAGKYLMTKRFFRIEHAELGISANVEIGKLSQNEDRMTYTFEGTLTSEADHVFDAATDTPERPNYENLTSDNAVQVVTGLQGTATGATGGSASILWAWDQQDDSMTQDIQLRSVPGGQPDWQVYGAGQGQNTFLATGLVDGAPYEAQVRNRTSAGRVGAWKPDSPVSVTAIADSSPPDPLTAFDATKIGNDVDVEFEAPNDAGYYATRIYRADYAEGYVGTIDFADAVLVRIEYGLPGNDDAWTDQSVPLGVLVYWAEPINSSGIAGARSGPVLTGA